MTDNQTTSQTATPIAAAPNPSTENQFDKDLAVHDRENYFDRIRQFVIRILSSRPDAKFGDFLASIENKKPEWHSALRGMSFDQIRQIFTIEPEAKKGKRASSKEPKVSVPSIEGFSQEDVKKKYAADVLRFVTEQGLTKSERGLASAEIRLGVGRGSDGQLRDVLSPMVEAGQIAVTGKARGIRYVAASLKDQAQANYDKQEAEKATKKPAKEKGEAKTEAKTEKK